MLFVLVFICLSVDRLHGGEEENVSDGGAIGEEHYETVNSYADYVLVG